MVEPEGGGFPMVEPEGGGFPVVEPGVGGFPVVEPGALVCVPGKPPVVGDPGPVVELLCMSTAII